MNKKLLSLYGLKFNPFSPEVPVEALWVAPPLDSFCWRIEQQVGEGGFALVIGDPGSGKSASLRVLRERLSNLRDVQVGILTRPQAGLADFYRELGDLFGVALQPHNRWASAKVLREKWHKHIESCLCRPALLIDEGQECCVPVLSELRLLSSTDLDSRQPAPRCPHSPAQHLQPLEQRGDQNGHGSLPLLQGLQVRMSVQCRPDPP